jgi:hypothetical protein
MSEPVRMPLHLDRIARLRDFLAAAQQLAADCARGDPTWAGMPESKAAAESTDPTASPALLNELNGAYAFAQMRVQAVMEHAESIATLWAEGGPPGSLAIDALTRAAVETAARARWVLEDGLSVAQRTSRFLVIEVHSAHHLDRLAQAMHMVPRDPLN